MKNNAKKKKSKRLYRLCMYNDKSLKSIILLIFLKIIHEFIERNMDFYFGGRIFYLENNKL